MASNPTEIKNKANAIRSSLNRAASKSAMMYNDPVNDVPSTIDGDASESDQLVKSYYFKKAIVDAAKHSYFGQLSSIINLPKNAGRKIERYRYIPLLDDRNLNNQGIDAAGATIDPGSGNLYGSSKDIGTIAAKLPAITEEGGRKNRVGFTRKVVSAEIRRYGFFYEITDEALAFDSDAQLYDHLYSEAVKAANEIIEANLQMQLITNAGVKIYPGTATSLGDVTGEGATPTVLDFQTLQRADGILTAEHCPRDTKAITGSLKTDTRTIPSSRYMFVSPATARLMKAMKDQFERPAFIPIEQYGAAAGKPIHGEIGSIANFRIIEVPEMQYWAGKGAAVTSNPGYMETDGKYDVHLCLVVGSDSFNSLGFGFDSKGGSRIQQKIVKPGSPQAFSSNDPFGTKGFISFQWFDGVLINRPEWLAIIHTVAPI